VQEHIYCHPGVIVLNPDIYLEGLHAIAAAEMFRTAARELGGEASFSRAIALFHLSHHGPQTISSLAAAVSLSHAAASRMVDGMVKNGLITRHEGKVDRRQKRVALAPAGEACIASLRLKTVEAYRQLLETLPDDLRDRFTKILKEVSAFVSTPNDALPQRATSRPPRKNSKK
jgi:DNA-binding MarR family transcriptional regulator